MLKGTRVAVIRRTQPVSIHGQISIDIMWTDPDDPEQELRHARVGDDGVPNDLQIGDTVDFHYLMGSVVQVTRR